MTTPQLDPRRNAFREDLADISLKEKVKAQRYVQGELRQVVAATAPLRVMPRFDAPMGTEALCGELLTVFESTNGWAWAQLANDRYVGYMPVDCISTIIDEPTHWINARATFVYPAPDLKRPPIMRLSLNSKLTVVGKEGRFLELSRGGFIFNGHVQPIEEKAKDFVRHAERLIGAPYLWGGRSSLGIDCSGLVQIALEGMGSKCPRDSDMQANELGTAVSNPDLNNIKRGDLVFWRGHVGIVQSNEWMIHASGHQMEVVVEPVRRAVERIATTHGNITSVRRLHGVNLTS